VLFDYYGTLTRGTSPATRRAGSARVALALGIPSDLLFEATTSTFTERSTGRCGDTVATMAWVADRCGYHPNAAQLAAACAVRSEIERGYAHMLRDDALPIMHRLRDHGIRLGVVSDCTHELAELWAELPVAPLVDAVVLSVTMGERKPHPSMYLTACGQLGIGPSEAVYIGDGGSNELTGAHDVGMEAVRLVTDDAAEALVYDREEGWTGPVVHSLTEFALGVLPAPSPSPTSGSL
jgi:putative hydrolase of the HAD superfamily